MLGMNMGDMNIGEMIMPLLGLFEGDFDFPVVISSVMEPLMGMFSGQLKMIGIDLDAIMPEVYYPIQDPKKFATGLCVPFVHLSLRASFYSASHFWTEILAREFAWLLKHRTVLYRLTS